MGCETGRAWLIEGHDRLHDEVLGIAARHLAHVVVRLDLDAGAALEHVVWPGWFGGFVQCRADQDDAGAEGRHARDELPRVARRGGVDRARRERRWWRCS